MRGGLSNHTGWVLASACANTRWRCCVRGNRNRTFLLSGGFLNCRSRYRDLHFAFLCVCGGDSFFSAADRSSSDRVRVGTAWHWGLGCRQSGTRARARVQLRGVCFPRRATIISIPSPLFRCLRACAPRILALCSGRRARPSRVVRSTVMCMGGLRLAPRAGQPQQIEDVSPEVWEEAGGGHADPGFSWCEVVGCVVRLNLSVAQCGGEGTHAKCLWLGVRCDGDGSGALRFTHPINVPAQARGAPEHTARARAHLVCGVCVCLPCPEVRVALAAAAIWRVGGTGIADDHFLFKQTNKKGTSRSKRENMHGLA